jgi:hypothetical protein
MAGKGRDLAVEANQRVTGPLFEGAAKLAEIATKLAAIHAGLIDVCVYKVKL